MQTLKRTKYFTMSSWNKTTAPAYNLKIYNVIDKDLQNKVYELLQTENFYFKINELIDVFDIENNYQYQAGFNGRSGGYLVLYEGGKKTKYLTKKDFASDNGYNGRVYISDQYHWKTYEEAKTLGLIDKEIITSIYTRPGLGIDDKDVSADVLKRFRKLAVDIVKLTENLARNCEVGEEEYTITKTRKILV